MTLAAQKGQDADRAARAVDGGLALSGARAARPTTAASPHKPASKETKMRNDTPTTLNLPEPLDLISHPAIRGRAEEYTRLGTEYVRATAKLDRLRTEHRAALTSEEDARIAAIRAGKPEPATKNSAKLAGDIERQERTTDATDAARLQACRELSTAIEEHRAEWLSAIADQLDDARDRFTDAVGALAAAHAHLAAVGNLRAWAREAPMRTKWHATGGYFQRLEGLVLYGGEPVSVEGVIEALRILAAPPAPPAPAPQHVPPGGRQSGRLNRNGMPQQDPTGPLHPTSRPAVTLEVDGNSRTVLHG